MKKRRLTNKHKVAKTPQRSKKTVAVKGKQAISSVAGKENKPELPEARMERMFKKLNKRIRNGNFKPRKVPSDGFIRMVVHLIHQGNVVETACRSLAVTKPIFRQWCMMGFDDVARGLDTQFSKFVVACDAAMAQEEAQQISRISRGASNWQAIAWAQERKSFTRWGDKKLIVSHNLEDMSMKTDDEVMPLNSDMAGDVMAVLEEAGVLALQDSPAEETEIDLTGPPVEIVDAVFEP